MAGRSYKTEAVVLRSFRFGEADRVLHLYTLERGRIGAVAKGIRQTKSRFGARLEPLSHVELMLHQGSGELQTVTGVELVRSHHEAREQQYRLGVGLVGAPVVDATRDPQRPWVDAVCDRRRSAAAVDAAPDAPFPLNLTARPDALPGALRPLRPRFLARHESGAGTRT